MPVDLEHAIARLFGRKYCLLTGSGTTALNLALRAAIPEKSKVLYPDFTCETALNASIYAGFNPAFCDVDPLTGNLDIDAATAMCRHDESIRAVVPTQIFGQSLEIDRLRGSTPRQEVFVLEDAAQGYGGEFQGRPIGAFGDAAIVSFGRGKAIDCGGGGAVLTDDRALFTSCERLARKLPPDDDEAAVRRSEFAKQFFLLSKAPGLSPGDLYRKKNALKYEFRDGFVISLSEHSRERLNARIPTARKIFEEFRRRAATWSAGLHGISGIALPPETGSPVRWRFPILADRRDEIYARLTSANIPAARYFMPLHTNYDLPDEEFPGAMEIYRRILSFPPDLSIDQINSICKIIAEVHDSQPTGNP